METPEQSVKSVQSEQLTIKGPERAEALVRRCSVKKMFLKNFAKFTGKHLCQSCSVIKKETLTQVCSLEFCEIFRKTFFYRTPPVVASERPVVNVNFVPVSLMLTLDMFPLLTLNK